jgi:hypothetical protein
MIKKGSPTRKCLRLLEKIVTPRAVERAGDARRPTRSTDWSTAVVPHAAPTSARSGAGPPPRGVRPAKDGGPLLLMKASTF